MIDRNDELRDDESRGSFVGKNRACSVGEFCKGWRRKVGLVTLAMACVLAVAWGRSHIFRGSIIIDSGMRSQHVIFSVNGGIYWRRIYIPSPDGERPHGFGIDWNSDDASIFGSFKDDVIYDSGWADWRWRWGDFFVGVDSYDGPNTKVTGWKCSHPSLVLPLTLLSAWLILVNPRKTKAATGGTP